MPDRHAIDIDRPSSVLEAQLELIDLSVARNNQLLNIPGNAVVGFDATDNAANVDLRFNNPTGDPFNLRHGRALRSDVGFSRIFLTNDAQAGKTLTLLVGDKPILALTPNVLDISGSAVIISSGMLTAVTDITNPIIENCSMEDHVLSFLDAIPATTTVTVHTVPAGEYHQVVLRVTTGANFKLAIGIAAIGNNFQLPDAIDFTFRVFGGGSGRIISVRNVLGTAGSYQIFVTKLR